MKRLVFCFDGTWNKLDAQYPTNVVLTAESVLPLTKENVAQVVFYDEGVGTSKFDRHVRRLPAPGDMQVLGVGAVDLHQRRVAGCGIGPAVSGPFAAGQCFGGLRLAAGDGLCVRRTGRPEQRKNDADHRRATAHLPSLALPDASVLYQKNVPPFAADLE